MLIPQLLSILSSAVVIGATVTHLPSMVTQIREGQEAITGGIASSAASSATSSSSSSSAVSGEILDGVVDGSSPQIDVGDVLSLTSSGRVTFGFHALLMRYPLDTYLAAMSPSASSPTAAPEVYTSAVVSIAPGSVQWSSSSKLSSSRRHDSVQGEAAGFSAGGDEAGSMTLASSSAPPALLNPLDPRAAAHTVRDFPLSPSSSLGHDLHVPSAVGGRGVMRAADAGLGSGFGPLSPIVRVNSSRGVVGIDQCTVLVAASASSSSYWNGSSVVLRLYSAEDGDGDRGHLPPSTSVEGMAAPLSLHDSDKGQAEEQSAALRDSLRPMGGGIDIDGGFDPLPSTPASTRPSTDDALSAASIAIPTGSSLPSLRTNAGLVLFREETVPVRPENECPHFTTEAAADTYAPLLPYTTADRRSYNRGQRGFPLTSDAFFFLKYLYAERQMSTQRMALPLVVDEDPVDSSSVFPFGLRGARRMGRATSSASFSSSLSKGEGGGSGRTAIFLVPIPKRYRQANFPASDTECVRLGMNRSTDVTNLGLASTPTGGSVPLLYHRGCFMAVVSPLSSAASASDSVSSAMATAVSQWLSITSIGAKDGVYRDSVMAVRRASSPSSPVAGEEGGFTGKDGSRWVFTPTRLGPSATSSVYRDLVAPMKDVFSSQYLPPMFISWVGGVYALGGTCTAPQFVDDKGARRISMRI